MVIINKIEKISKKKVTQFGTKYYKDEDVAKVFGPRIPSYTEEEVEEGIEEVPEQIAEEEAAK